MRTLPEGDDLVATGADLEPATLLTAYRSGYFPMPLQRRRIGWFSPDPRGVLFPGELKVSRSLTKSMRRFRFTTNAAFDEVIRACGDPIRPHGWIDRNIIQAYTQLHHMGWVHSVEAWDDEGLAGGLYGLRIGGFFAGESMFHRRTDASKAALVHLSSVLGHRPHSIIDVQWSTDHLESLGVRAVDRRIYGDLLGRALDLSPVESFDVAPNF